MNELLNEIKLVATPKGKAMLSEGIRDVKREQILRIISNNHGCSPMEAVDHTLLKDGIPLGVEEGEALLAELYEDGYIRRSLYWDDLLQRDMVELFCTQRGAEYFEKRTDNDVIAGIVYRLLAQVEVVA